MSDAEDIAVVIEPEPQGDPNKERARDPETGKFVKAEPDPAVEELKSQYGALQQEAEREKNARLAADRRAAEASADAQRARKEADSANVNVVESQLDTVTQGIAAAQSDANSAEQAYVAAQEAGNWAEAAKAQRRMAASEAKIGRLEEAKADLEARKADPSTRQARTEAPQRGEQQTTDPVERYIQGRSEPTANWLREHRDWVTDPKKNNKLTAAHYNAVGEGLTVDTEAYFEHVESFLGLRQNNEDNKSANGAGNGAQPPKTRRASPPAAPVGQSGGGTSGRSGTEVRLSAIEARAAQDGTIVWNYDDPSGQKRFKKGDPVGVQEFARRKLEMTKQGVYDRTYTES